MHVIWRSELAPILRRRQAPYVLVPAEVMEQPEEGRVRLVDEDTDMGVGITHLISRRHRFVKIF